jgi:hypothetical protein
VARKFDDKEVAQKDSFVPCQRKGWVLGSAESERLDTSVED